MPGVFRKARRHGATGGATARVKSRSSPFILKKMPSRRGAQHAAWRWKKLRGKPVWVSTAIAEGAALVQIVLGVILVASKDYVAPRFHMFYGFVIFITIGILYQYRSQMRGRLELLYGLGLRVSECCGLDVGDVELRRRTVTVLGKGSKIRRLPLGRRKRRPAAAACRAKFMESPGV